MRGARGSEGCKEEQREQRARGLESEVVRVILY